MQISRRVLRQTLPLVVAACLLSACEQGKPPAAVAAGGGMPAPAVTVLTVSTQALPFIFELPGRTTPYLIAELRPQISGIVTERTFVEGSEVKRGQLLYRIDAAPYQASFDSARASLSRAEANLHAARLKAERHAELVKIEAVSQQANDDAQAALLQARAEVAAAKAAVDKAKVDLDYTQLKAPISGRIGRSSVTAGALVTANQTQSLATVQQLDPIYVDLSQSSVELLRLREDIAAGHIQTNDKGEIPVELVLEDGKVYPSQGRLTLAEVSVDESTGSVTLRASVPNGENVLLPGMFVRARIAQGVRQDVVRLPHAAVQHDPRGKPYVLLVDGESKVVSRMVTTAQTLGADWVISAGLESGERVIVEGLQKVRPGAQVVAQEAGAAPAAASSD